MCWADATAGWRVGGEGWPAREHPCRILDKSYRIYRNPLDSEAVATPMTNVDQSVITGISTVHANVLDLIGNTPVVDVSNLSPNPNVRIIAKLEMQNPFGSVKDRIAKAMIEAAEKD